MVSDVVVKGYHECPSGIGRGQLYHRLVMLLSPYLDVFVYLFLMTIQETIRVTMFLLEAVY